MSVRYIDTERQKMKETMNKKIALAFQKSIKAKYKRKVEKKRWDSIHDVLENKETHSKYELKN